MSEPLDCLLQQLIGAILLESVLGSEEWKSGNANLDSLYANMLRRAFIVQAQKRLEAVRLEQEQAQP